MDKYKEKFCESQNMKYCIYYETKECPKTCSYAIKQSKLEKEIKNENRQKLPHKL